MVNGIDTSLHTSYYAYNKDCNNCKHKEVCKYASEFMDCKKNIEKLTTPSFVSVDVSCIHYEYDNPFNYKTTCNDNNRIITLNETNSLNNKL